MSLQVRNALEDYLQLAGRPSVVHAFNLKHLHALLRGGYELVEDFVDARDIDLERCGLPPAKVGVVLRDQDKGASSDI